jgi:hypothetical protein
MSKKTTELFKIAAGPGLGLLGGMDPATKQRLMSGLQNSVLPAAAVALPSAVIAGATADRGEGVGDALRTGLGTGAMMLGGGLAHNMMMGGKSPLSHSYQRGIGSDIRNIANKGREAMGTPTVKMPRPPKVASVESFKIANPYEDPYAAYGQYGREPRDEGTSALNKALLLGAGTLGAAGLHSSLMNARGKIMGGGLINAYQKGLGGGIRTTANTLRGHVGMDPVAQPPPAIIGHAQDAAAAAKAHVQEAMANAKDYAKPAMAVAGAAATAKGTHDKFMAGKGRGSQAYQRFVGKPLESAANKAVEGAGRAADWVVRKTAPKKKEPPAEKTTTTPPKSEDTKVGSMIYDAGVAAALATDAL